MMQPPSYIAFEEAAFKIGLLVNAKKTEFMAFNQAHTGSIKSKTNQDIKTVQEFTYLGSNIASTKRDIEIRFAKAWSALNKLYKIWKSNLSPKLKRNFFRATVESVLLYGATSWTLTKTLEKMLDGAYTRMLRAVLNISWREHPTKKVLYGDLPPISQTLRDRRLRFAGHCFGSKEELAGDLEGRAVIGKLDVDSNPATSAKFGIRSIPTLLVFKGGEIVDKQVGAVPKGVLSQKLDAQF